MRGDADSSNEPAWTMWGSVWGSADRCYFRGPGDVLKGFGDESHALISSDPRCFPLSLVDKPPRGTRRWALVLVPVFFLPRTCNHDQEKADLDR